MRCMRKSAGKRGKCIEHRDDVRASSYVALLLGKICTARVSVSLCKEKSTIPTFLKHNSILLRGESAGYLGSLWIDSNGIRKYIERIDAFNTSVIDSSTVDAEEPRRYSRNGSSRVRLYRSSPQFHGDTYPRAIYSAIACTCALTSATRACAYVSVHKERLRQRVA